MLDFLIIGGGIAGLSTAARLAPLGTTRVLESEDALSYHASGRSAALYAPDYGHGLTRRLNMASGPYLREAGVLSPRGLMIVARKGDEDVFGARKQALNMRDMPLDAAFDRVPILSPDAVGHAAINEDVSDIDTDLLLQGFVKEARAHGAEILLRQHVSDISRNGRGWAVSTGDTTHEARIIFNAAGAWVDGIARMAGVAPLGVTPMRRSMARIPAPGGHDVSGWPMLLDIREQWYAKPDAGSLIVSPAEEDPQEPHDAWADDMVLAEGLARYEAFVTEPVTRLEANWAGLRTFAPDRDLVIGPAPDASEFFWVAGQGGNGIQSTAAAALLVADLVAGRTPDIGSDTAAALSPERFA
ncbi:Glycine/D-amino acid oxidase [Salinihabitans flavidus]|uniref:Glycine/D-amino acid oxidase n=1 Tax=Salinihabitans flavidus TaxID=569882 RepID=A0A1H8LLT5_9RHOB|nr:FAD-binding oxidoreductase [Salinihabitans flavidus]SEO05983.1 Glycine/D-amino acid oxidase [Salinihabitans flavidus]